MLRFSRLYESSYAEKFENISLKHVSIKTNSGQMHLNEGAGVFAHVARIGQMHLDAVIFN